MEFSSSRDLPAKEALDSQLRPEEYVGLFRRASLMSMDSDLESNVRVVDKLSPTDERDRLLSLQDQNTRGIISIARSGFKRQRRPMPTVCQDGAIACPCAIT